VDFCTDSGNAVTSASYTAAYSTPNGGCTGTAAFSLSLTCDNTCRQGTVSGFTMYYKCTVAAYVAPTPKPGSASMAAMSAGVVVAAAVAANLMM
jgi:hypothetical protein